MILDLTNLSSEYTERLNEIAHETGDSYTHFVDECSRKYGDTHLFWVTPFSSRNTYNDATYLQLCRVLLAEEAVRNNKADEVITATYGEYEVLKKLLAGRARVGLLRSLAAKASIMGVLKRWRHFFNFLKRQIVYVRYADAHFDYPDEFAVVVGPAISTDFNGYEFNDRYTTGITDYHDALFLPYYVNTQSIPDRVMFDRIRRCRNCRFIFDRDLVKVPDVTEVLAYWRYADRLGRKTFLFRDIDITPIVRQNLEAGKNNAPAFDALIIRRMLERLAAKNVKIKSFIQWYEGRPFDNVTSESVRRLFPDSACVGYEGYPLIESCLGEYISAYQLEAGYAPKVMAVPGRMYEKDARRFCSDVPLIYVPSLRNEYFKASPGDPDRSEKTLLVLLSGLMDAAAELIRTADRFMAENGGKYRIIFKNHPANTGFTEENYGIKGLSFVPSFVNGKLRDCLDGVDAVLTSVTTSTLETAYSGIPLIILYPKGQLGFTALPSGIREKFCRVIYDSDELGAALEECLGSYADTSELDASLAPPSEESVLQMFRRDA